MSIVIYLVREGVQGLHRWKFEKGQDWNFEKIEKNKFCLEMVPHPALEILQGFGEVRCRFYSLKSKFDFILATEPPAIFDAEVPRAPSAIP